MILDQIIRKRKEDVEALKAKRSIEQLIKQIEASHYRHYSFKEGLSNKEKPIRIIAEIKKASPSKGLICENFDYLKIAKAYEEGGAAAISVLTEPRYFQGDSAYLSAIKQVVELPLLRKDFIFDEWQIYEARAIGADAILLIVAALEKKELKTLLELAHSLSMDVLVETHNEEEVELALEVGAKIIGVNNRNLQSFEVSLEVSKRLRKLIPDTHIFVGESGIHFLEDMHLMKSLGADAVLIGEHLMRSSQPAQMIKHFMFD